MFADPFETVFNLQQALDAYRASSWLDSGTSGTGAYPPINVFRKDDGIVIVAEIPGVRKSDVEIQIKENSLRIAGAKAVGYAENASVHRRERLAGRFDRAISIPFAIDADNVRAQARDGILTVTVPRHPREKPRSINIG